MNTWSKLQFQGRTFGLRTFEKKKKRPKKARKFKKRMVTEGEQVQRDFEIMLRSSLLSEKTKLFLKKLRGSYGQFKRFTPSQFRVFKEIWWEMKDKQKKEIIVLEEDLSKDVLFQEYKQRLLREA